ncbi:carbohydrate-binding protein [Pontibacter sp. E15-1]|uniref:carbohydrate-binding protein n=1 Tax=Pontibacter sp. E15-1 TaxID=2919918 RepID=UPI001F501E3E|nr:carbohydrate-binding protein [Pontibacter sp. E15-1]MCJ8164279.1 carbohydrate-binding protein [Pontibacter sp. E15-1]
MENYYSISGITILETTDPFARIEAEDYDDISGPKVGNTGDVDGVQNLGAIKPGHWSMYAALDLTDVKSIKARVASIYNDAFIEVRLNAPDGQLIGTVDVPQTGAWQVYATATAYIEDVTGVYDVYLVYKNTESSYVCNINWFQFSDEFVAPPIDPYVRFEAENYNGESGTSIANTSDVDGKKDVSNIQNGDWIKFTSLDISKASRVDLRVAGISNNAQIELRLDAVDGPVIAFVDVPNTGSLSTWATISTQVDQVADEHDIYLVFTGQGENLFRLNWLQFKVYENPFARIEAEDYDAKEWKKGNVGGTTDAEDKGVGSIVKSIVPGDWIMFNDVDLTGVKSINARFGSIYNDAYVEVRSGSAEGLLLGTINLHNTGGWHNWETTSANLEKVTGTHDLYFVFLTETSANVCNLNWFQLSGQRLEEKDIYSRIEAEDYNLANGTKTESTSDADGGKNVGTIQDGNWLLFKSLDLSEAGGILTRVASINDGGTIELRLGSSTGTHIGTVNVPNTGGWQNWQTAQSNIDAVEGVYDLYLVFKGASSYLFNINWLQFVKKPIVIEDSTTIEAEAYFTQSGVKVQATSDIDGGEHVSLINNGDNISFDLEVLSGGIYNVSFRVSPKTSGSSIIIRKDDGTTEKVMVPDAGNGEEWQTISTYLKLASGVQSLSFEFAGEGSNLSNLNWIEFELTDMAFSIASKTKGAATDNSIETQLELVNTGGSAVSLDDVTLRYWFTAEEFAPLTFFCDWAQIGAANINSKFVTSTPARTGGYTYLELSFAAGLELASQAGTGPIQTRVAKNDWTDFDEKDDHSYLPSSSFLENAHITLYKNGVLIWGEEPEVELGATSFVVAHKAGDASKPKDNSIKPQFNINNTGNVAVPLSDVKVRYWFTAEGSEAMNFWVDWAELGKSNVSGMVYTMDAPTATADRYLELSFNSTDTLHSLSSTGEIRTRMAKSDWSAFDETNDHSYVGTREYQANPHVTVYVKDELVYGTEPGGIAHTGVASAVKAIGFESTGSLLLYPNPVKDNATLNFTLAEAGKVEFTILSLTGQRVRSEVKALPLGDQQVKLDVQGLAEGVYLLQLHSQEVNAVLRFVKTH